ncbi:MAG: hypothetical protein QW039_01375 [Fervidicoccaceae archaeon]
MSTSSNNCPDIIVDQERGEIICLSTGEVLGSILDSGPEWREFESGEGKRRSRVGSPLTNSMHDYGISTTISEQDIRKLNFSQRKKMYMLRRRIASTRMRENKRMISALTLLKEEASRLQLPQVVIETASLLMRKVVEAGLGRGEKIRAYAAAALYISCKLAKIPRSFAHLASVMEVDEESVRYAYRKIVELSGGKINAKVSKPIEYVPSFVKVLSLSKGTEKLMYRLSNAVERTNMLQGKSPIAVAAAIAYISSAIMGEKRNQRDIASAFGTFTDVAVRNRYRDIVDNLYIEVIL